MLDVEYTFETYPWQKAYNTHTLKHIVELQVWKHDFHCLQWPQPFPLRWHVAASSFWADKRCYGFGALDATKTARFRLVDLGPPAEEKLQP